MCKFYIRFFSPCQTNLIRSVRITRCWLTIVLLSSVCSEKDRLSYYLLTNILISHGGLGFSAAVITLTRSDKLKCVFKGFVKKYIFIWLLIPSQLSIAAAFFPPCCCLNCLEQEIISLLNSAVLFEDTLSGFQSFLKWTFRVIISLLLHL